MQFELNVIRYLHCLALTIPVLENFKEKNNKIFKDFAKLKSSTASLKRTFKEKKAVFTECFIHKIK